MQTAATRTDTVEIQTESVTLINSEVQVNTMVAEMQCQTSEIQVSESDQQSYDTSSDMQPKRGVHIAVGDEGGTLAAPQMSMMGGGALTTRAGAARGTFSFSSVDEDTKDTVVTQEDRQKIKEEVQQSLSQAELKKQKQAAYKKKMADDYQKNRDPIKEFFTLTCQSVKLNSPHMNLIAMINTDQLYNKALEAAVPYFKYSSWIESTVSKEVIQQLFKTKQNDPKRQVPKDLITGDVKKIE